MSTIQEKYNDAEKLLLKHTKNAVLNGKVKAIKLDDSHFYYAKESGYPVTEYEFIKVDVQTGNKEPLFDHAKLLSALKEMGLAEKITFGAITYSESEILFELNEKIYSYSEGKITDCGYITNTEDVFNEYYRVFNKEGNLYREDLSNNEVLQLTFDGARYNSYGTIEDDEESITSKVTGRINPLRVKFSHDGQRLITYRVDERNVKDLYIIQGYDDEHLESIRPRLHTYKCAFPEDKDVPEYYYYIINLKDGKTVQVDHKPFRRGVSATKWSKDDSFITATWVERGYQNGELIKIYPEDGSCDVIVQEHTETFLNLGSYGKLDGFGEYGYSNFITEDGKLAVFQSERDDMARYFTYNPDTKECLGAITPEDSIAERMIAVDEINQWIYYMAGNIPLYSDPYYEGFCRVHFDGSGFEVLTKEDAHHYVQFFDTFFIDTYSRVDLPPVTVLYDVNGKKISTIEEADITNLMELGYIIPKRFTVKARDGKTDLYGILIEPEHKEGEVVPYVDHIYGGPQTYFVPKAFTWDHVQGREIFGGLQSLAKVGIAGIMIDGLGTPGRGKKLHNYSWQNIHGCNGLLDHVTMAKELKEKFPFIDIKNVGIWGNSGGGCATSRALLEYPDYFKVGVSSAGNHDQRMYNNGWTERYYGVYSKNHKQAYLDGDNTALAKNLKGKLLIVHGMMDDNVTLSESLRLVDALIRENKDFDFFVLPRCNHNVPADPYFQRRKLDYFVKNLLGIEPPKDVQF